MKNICNYTIKELEDYLVYINETYFNFKFERI